MSASLRRLIGIAMLATVAFAAVATARQLIRFGVSPDGPARRLDTETRAIVESRRIEVEALAAAVAQDPAIAAAIPDSGSETARLFDALAALTSDTGPDVSATVYVPTSVRDFRAVAWSNGPSDSVEADRLAGDASIFLAHGTAGLRLIALRPVRAAPGGALAATVVAETVLASVEPGGGGSRTVLPTSFGRIPAVLSFAGAGAIDDADTQLVIPIGTAGARLELRYDAADLEARRRSGWRLVAAAALTPLAILALLLAGPALGVGAGGVQSRLLALLAAGGGVTALMVAAILSGVPASIRPVIAGFGLLLVAVLLPVRAWWTESRSSMPWRAPLRFGVEHLLAGGVAAALLATTAWWTASGPDPLALARWHSPLFPLDPEALASLTALLLVMIAGGWSVAASLALVAVRWRIRRLATPAFAAAALWSLPTLALVVRGDVPTTILVALGTAVVFALAAARVRRRYRRASQATRLLLLFAALCAPALALYPLAAADASRRARTLVADDYGPATSGHWQRLGQQVAAAQAAIDRVPTTQLVQLASTPPPEDGVVTSSAAYTLWSQTGLDDARVTSEIELFDAAGRLVSRFALNVPDDRQATTFGPWDRSSCDWVTFGDAGRIGAEDRAMLHAERGVCDDTGRVVGAVVLHVVFDYRSLEFIVPASPYELAFAADADRGPAIPRLQVAAYGWGGTPVFASGPGAWPLGGLLPRLYGSRDPFWLDLAGSDGRAYHVYFSQNRAGIYAIGFPVPTLFTHATRLAELLAVLAVLAALLLAGATAAAPLTRRRQAPIRLLYREVRTSFYRKLFLLFVLAAIGPVVLLSLAIGAYLSAQFRTDVETEAATLASTARRVLEEVAAIEARAGSDAVATDEVMVWVAQLLDQDVHLYDGPQLVATSQRNLFDSGLLSPRAPAAAYRAVVLDRLPTFVSEDRIGTLPYLVAAAPVPARGREAFLGLPMASRQQEIDRELDELNRGVLVGAVLVVLLAAGLGASVASRVSDPVARLTRATRLIAAGRLDVRIAADTADELRRLVDDFNTMTETLRAQRAELARTHQLQAWAEMAREVAHEIKNPLTPIQLATDHLQRVHDDRQRPLGPVFDQCLATISTQVGLLRRIASEFSTFASRPEVRLADVAVTELVDEVLTAYRFDDRVRLVRHLSPDVPAVRADRTLLARALTNVVENARQAMPDGGDLTLSLRVESASVVLEVCDTGVGMDADVASRAFDPYFSTKTGGSGLGLANARRNVELCGGAMTLVSRPGAGTCVTMTLPAASAPPGAS